jgi:hypothetical protein
MFLILSYLNGSDVSIILLEAWNVAIASSCKEYYMNVMKGTRSKIKMCWYSKKKLTKKNESLEYKLEYK